MCDRYSRWFNNLQAIVVTLERLRLASYHGVMQHDEQYTGFNALPGGSAPPPAEQEFEGFVDAASFILETAGVGIGGISPQNFIRDGDTLTTFFREAIKKVHPDKGGDAGLAGKLNRARDFIRTIGFRDVKGWEA